MCILHFGFSCFPSCICVEGYGIIIVAVCVTLEIQSHKACFSLQVIVGFVNLAWTCREHQSRSKIIVVAFGHFSVNA